MTYAKKYGKYAVMMDGTVYKWFTKEETARQYWREHFTNPEMVDEWHEEYDAIELVDKDGSVLEEA